MIFSKNPKEHVKHVHCPLQTSRKMVVWKNAKYFFINQKSNSWATLFLTMAYRWIQRNFIPSSISKPQFLFMMSNVSWDLQTFIIFLSKTIQRLLPHWCDLQTRTNSNGTKMLWNFQIVKNAFIATSILIHTNPSNPFILEAYALIFSFGAMLS